MKPWCTYIALKFCKKKNTYQIFYSNDEYIAIDVDIKY